MQDTEQWLMALPPSSFNQFAKGPMQAVRLVENSVAWIPYGWVTMTINAMSQAEYPRTLVIPYLNAKLALGYPSLSVLVNFHLDYVKSVQGMSSKYWADHGRATLSGLATSCARRTPSSPRRAVPSSLRASRP